MWVDSRRLRVRGLGALALFGASGCDGPQSALAPRGQQAQRLLDLTVTFTIVCGVVLAVVIGLVLVAIRLPRRESDPDREHRHVIPVAVGTALMALVLVALLLYGVGVSRAIAERPPSPLPIRVIAHQWWWEVIYPGEVGEPESLGFTTANEVRIPVGRPVEITLESRDVIHSFWVPSLHGKLDAIPGRKTRLWLEANQPGVYRGQCAEFCGLQHAKMALVVVAEPAGSFERWRDSQRRPAPEPEGDLASRGRDVFVGSACVTCHTIRGTDAMAKAGPDLTHLASRLTLGAGALANERGALGGWLAAPQHTKPGTMMPPSDLEPADLQALLHYLASLE